MSSTVLSPLTWRPPYLPTPLVDTGTGAATPGFDRNLRDLTTIIGQLAGVNVQNFGAAGNGTTDDTAAFQSAIGYAINQGGGIIYVPAGTYAINTIFFPAGTIALALVGQGNSSILQRLNALTAGQGLIDISTSNVQIINLLIDGNTTVSTGLQYGVGFATAMSANDPMAPSLTTNSSIWAHGPLSNLLVQNVQIQHTGGYAVLLDGFPGTINDPSIIGCNFFNNRPATFGTAVGQLIYGSWNGGVYANGDGRATGSGVVNGLLVDDCRFERNTGNCVWTHVYGLNELHASFTVTNNRFLDCGLDGIEAGGVTGGIVANNHLRRVGYICSDDTSGSVPRWLQNLNATAIDSSGLVKSVIFANNSMLDVNGGFIDTDGHCFTTISGNVCRIAQVGEPEYTEDSVAIMGNTNSGPTSYGLNANNSMNTVDGGSNVNVIANTFLYLPGGSIRLFAARNWQVSGNFIYSPATPISPPVSMGPVGPGPNQRATGIILRGNYFFYNPAVAAPCIYEDASIVAFVATDVNQVFANQPIQPYGTLATEFQPNAGSGSPTYTNQVWF